MMDGGKDPKEQEFVDEVANKEKQFWVLVNSKGLWHPDVQNSYHRLCSCYATIILQNLQLSELQDIEYSLWKLHYKQIDEFRKKRNSKPLGVAKMESFLSDASHFYTNLLFQVRSKWIPTTPKWRILSHRFLICLGDLARYKELYTKPEVDKNKDWSVAARHYSEACFTWPDSGNPHNQLALLATYIGDDLLALYHFVRSLAAKEPFLDSSNNLMLILEKSRSYNDDETPFDFLRPYRRMNPLIKEGQSCKGNELWPRLVRMMSFFYTKPCRLEEFPLVFAATVRHLDILMELDDKRLKETMVNSYSTKSVQTRAIQSVSIFIFLIHDFLKKSSWSENSWDKVKEEDPMLRVYAFCSTFIFMGRLVDRCTSSSSSLENYASFSLLPSVVIFTEWLVTVFDQVKSASSFSSEEEKASLSYFVGSLGLLLNRLERDGVSEVEYQHPSSSSTTTTLWPEDIELRGFSPMAAVHDSFEFSSTSMSHRTHRAITAAKRIIDSFVDMKSAVEDEDEDEDEEKEVILFKPLTRYNSAPVHNKDSDGVLRRATSLLSPQNHNPAVAVVKGKAPLSISRDLGSPSMAAGPPSLSAWVINGVGIQEMSNACCFLPIKEDDDDDDEDVTITTSYSSPIPSAPLLPEDAAWVNSIEEDKGIVEENPPPPPPDNTHLYYSTDLTCSNSNDGVFYPISCGMSSSEWLQQFREMNNLHGDGRPRLLLGNFNALTRATQCRAGRILGDQQKDDYPPLPDIYQKPSPRPYVTVDQMQYLKNTQQQPRWMQKDPSFHT